MRKVTIKRGLVLTWLLSYVAVLLISFVCTMIIYGGYNKALNTQSRNINLLASGSVTKNVEDILISTRKIYFDISFNDAVDKLCTMKSVDEYYNNREITEFKNQLYNYGRYKNNVDMFFLYIPKTDAVISDKGIVDSEAFYRAYVNYPKTYDKWMDCVKGRNNQSYSMVELRDASGVYEAVLCSMPVIRALNNDVENAVVVTATSKKRFFEGALQENSLYPYDVFIYDENDELILWKDKCSKINEMPKKIPDVYKYSGNKTVICNNITFDGVKMTVVTSFSKKMSLGNLEYIRTVFFLLILVSLIISTLTIAYFIHRNYLPVKELMEVLGINEKSGEYAAMRMSIEKTLNSNSMMASELKNNQMILEKIELSHILCGKYIDEETKKKFKKFRYEQYCVAAFSVHSLDKMFEENHLSDEKKYNELRFIVANIMEELLSTEFTSAYVVDVDDLQLCVINFQADKKQFVWEKLLYGMNFIDEQFCAKLSVGISSVYDSFVSIHEAYKEAVSLAEYKNLFAVEENIQYDDRYADDEAVPYLWTMECEQKFLRHLNSGNYGMCKDLLLDILADITQKRNYTPNYIKCLLIDITATLIKGGSNKKFDHQLMIKEKTIGEITEELLDECRKICEKNVNFDKDSELRLCEEVICYIHKNYNNPNLCSDSLGKVFGMTGPYLSKKFKTKTNESLTNYITQYRLEKSKELIRTTRYNLNTISEMVGFNHIRTYNRLFKKYEDMTPSEYKEKYGK